MKKTNIHVLNSLLAGILICGMLAACGAAEKNFAAPENLSEIQKNDNVPTYTARVEQKTEPENAPETEKEPAEAVSEEIPENGNDENIQKIIDTAESLLGIKYASGKCSPEEGFDSSGFAMYCLKEAGIDFPRRIQLGAGEEIGYSALKPGDVAFFSAEEGGKANFCGIYAGGGLIIYSPAPGGAVKTANITTSYWTQRFVKGVRPAA